MEDKALRALTLWECLDGRQRGRLATQLDLKADLQPHNINDPTPPPPPAGPRHGGVPGYVDVGITAASAQATLAVEWKVGADAWKQAQSEGATLYVSLHGHHPKDESGEVEDANKHDLCRLPIDAAQGKAQFPAAQLNLNGSMRAGLEARLLKVTKKQQPKKQLLTADNDLPSDADLAVMAKSGVVNIVAGTLERTWSMQIERVAVLLNTSSIPLTPPKAEVAMKPSAAAVQPQSMLVAANANSTRREDVVAALRDDFEEDMTAEEREAAFGQLWSELSDNEQAKLRPHLMSGNRGREIVPERSRRRRTDKKTKEEKEAKKAKKLFRKLMKKMEDEKSYINNDNDMSRGGDLRGEGVVAPLEPLAREVIIPSTVEPLLEAAAAQQRLADDDQDQTVDDEDDDWVVLGAEAQLVEADTECTVTLSFVEVTASIQPSVVWNLTETQYYDWIGVVDGETGETVAKVSINSLVSWTNPVGAHSWTENMTSSVKGTGLSKKYYAVMWRWHESVNQYHALGYSSNIIRAIVSLERRELIRQNVTGAALGAATPHLSAAYKEEALLCAQLACAAYKSYDELPGTLPPPLEAAYKIACDRTDTQGFVALDKSDGIAYVAYKGSWELADFMNDADLFLGPFVEKPTLKAQYKMVECYKSVGGPICELLLKYLKDKTITKITVTGHSLGAALACIMVQSILHDTRFDPYKLDASSLLLYTFACPRSFDWAANADSVKQLDKDRATMLSFVDQNDPVATGAWGFLKYFGYYHVGSIVLLSGSGHAMSNYINLIKAIA